MKILLATDGSAQAESAALWLSQLPRHPQLELTILAVKAVHEGHASIDSFPAELRNREAEVNHSVAACARAEAMFQGLARIESYQLEGHPGVTIVEQAERRGVDLVIVGARGHSLLERVFLGSTSDFVATHAPCSVAIIRPNVAGERRLQPTKFCVALDDSEASRAALDVFGALNWKTDGKLDLLHVIIRPYSYAEVPIVFDLAEMEKAAEAMLEKVAARWKDKAASVQCHVIESGHVGCGIVSAAESKGDDMIVMGDTGRGLLGRFLIGSASRYVLHHAHCSVAIARRKKTDRPATN